jgi:serine/threonine-protein kinase
MSAGRQNTTGGTPIPHVGRVLADRWVVGDRIGVGGMASVHACQDRRLARAVAIKILHHHVAESPDARERLAREARAIAQLKHENVIEVYDYSIDDPDCTWLVTELIDGYSLRQFLDRNEAPPPEVAVMIVTEVVRALKAAHAVGVVHRDVKPDNILIGRVEGRPKLSDFGIAKVVSETSMTITGNLVGSPSYMSPEQADGQHTDHRTDLYSAGILLYRMVTGTLPYRGLTPMDTIRKVAAGQYTDPIELQPACPLAIAAIIRKSLTMKIEERYQSAEELLADLGQVLSDSALTATWEELPRYFANPKGYWDLLKQRLARELEARGKALLDAGQESRAVDCFNRAISLGEGSQNTFDLVRELSKRRNAGRVRRFVWASALALGGIASITAVLLVTDLLSSNPPPPPAMAAPAPIIEVDRAKFEPPPPEVEAPMPMPDPMPDAPKMDPMPDAHAKKKTSKKHAKRKAAAMEEPKLETSAAPPEKPIYGTLQVGTDKWADVFVDDQRVGRAPDRTQYPLPPGEHRLRAEQPNSNCLPFERTFTISPGETTRVRLKVVCP